MLNAAHALSGAAYEPGGPDRSPAALIQEHQALVRRIAWHVHSGVSSAIEVADLIQIGLLALVEAAQGFEHRGAAFAPYAATRVRGAMIDALRREARMRRSGMVARRQLEAARRTLESRLRRHATDAEMASAMGLDAAGYQQLVQSTEGVRTEPIDDIYSDHDPRFADDGDQADTMLERAEEHARLARHLSALGEREAQVLHLYFTEEMNLEEIGQILGVGAARVCQIKKAALDKMRAAMASRD